MKKIILIGLFLLLKIEVIEAREINAIIIHHSMSGDVSAATIDRWHRARGWKEIGYHYVVRADGTVENGRSVKIIGAHAKGKNANSIGICLTGRSHFTVAQIKSLKRLLGELVIKYKIERISRHNGTCPGPGLNLEWIVRTIHSEIITNRERLNSYGKATYYKDWSTASGENMFLQPWAKTCASWFYPMGTKLRVTNSNNGKFVIVRVNDRGPRKDKVLQQNRIIDLSPAAFEKLAPKSVGIISVSVKVEKN